MDNGLISKQPKNGLQHLYCESAVFIADLHLSQDTPCLLSTFQQFCRQINPLNTQYLIILGDLFEAYCGDDDRNIAIDTVEMELLILHQRGVKVAFMPGNRDFLINTAFINRCHLIYLNSPCVLHPKNNQAILLAHGDEWCTLDIAYQAFRLMSRQETWQVHFLSQSLPVRQNQVQHYREQSKINYLNTCSQSIKIMDVEEKTVLSAAITYRCHIILHGHTHKPGVKQLNTEHNKAVLKYVLGDWSENKQYPIVYGVLSKDSNLELSIF